MDAHESRLRPRILVADDEPLANQRIATLIENEGYEFSGRAETEREAVSLARSLRPDLVVLDFGTPARRTAPQPKKREMDDLDACAAIQRELGIPVVLLTAREEKRYLIRARRTQPCAYLLKPCSEGQLRASLQIALARREADLNPSENFRLREAHHRIKNNFSLLHSMLRIQEMQTENPQARKALAAASARVLAMAEAHEAISRCGLDARSDGRVQVERVARALFSAQVPVPSPRDIRLELDLKSVLLVPAQVTPCGIFVAEALTNSLKHAFPDGRGGCIRVVLGSEAGRCILSVSDDGSGLAGDPEKLGAETLGLRCLSAAAEQLGGHLCTDAENGRGTRFSVRFPLRTGAYRRRSA